MILIGMPYSIQLFVAGDELSRRMIRTLDKITKLLTERFGPRIRSSSRDFIAYVLTSNIISLSLRQGTTDVIRLTMYFALETYREELKARFEVTDFPAVKFNGRTYTGEKALEITSRLHDLLKMSPAISDDELLAEIKKLIGQEPAPESGVMAERPSLIERSPVLSVLQKGIEPAVKAASRVTSSLTRTIQPTALPPSEGARAKAITGRTQPEVEPAPKGLVDKIIFERNVVRAGISECLAKLERLREEGKIDENAYRKMKEVYNSFLS